MRTPLHHTTPPRPRFVRGATMLAIGVGAPLLAACATRPLAPAARPRLAAVDALTPAPPARVGLHRRLGAQLDSIVWAGLDAAAAPGAVLAVGRYGRLVHLAGYGTLDWGPVSPRAEPSTVYDLASLTKVVATTTAAMILEEEGRLDLAQPVSAYVPEFSAPDKAAITVRMLLTHTGGLEAYAPLYRELRGRAQFLERINARPLRYAPGSQTVYSDWDMVLLQAVVERIAGQPLDIFAAERIFQPLGMASTGFHPDTANAARRRQGIAPTARDSGRGGVLQGTVHDGNAWAIGGVSGHAGLFSSARDLAVFAQLLVNGGSYGGRHIVSPETLARWTARQGPAASRALGWDTPAPNSSAGRYFSPRAFGHTGFTGTSLWVDPERGLFVVLLMNRVHPLGASQTRYARLRRDVADAVQAAVLDAPLVEWEQGR